MSNSKKYKPSNETLNDWIVYYTERKAEIAIQVLKDEISKLPNSFEQLLAKAVQPLEQNSEK